MNQLPRQMDIEEAVDIATFDQQLEQRAQNIERIQRDAVLDIGQELLEAQDLHRYSGGDEGFTKWLARRLPHIPQASAYRMIEIAKGIQPEMFINLINMKTSTLSEVAKAEPDIQAIIAERVAAGEIFTAAKVRDLKQQAAAEAVERINADAEAARRDLQALRAELATKDQRAASETKALQDSIAELTAKLRGYESEVEKFRKSLPKPEKAKEQAAETGGVVLARDGKYHSGSTAEEKRASNAFLAVFSIAADLTDRREPAAIAAIGCPSDSRDQFARYCDAAIAYLIEVRDNLNGQ